MSPSDSYKETLSKDLGKIGQVQDYTRAAGRRITGVGLAVLFLGLVWIGVANVIGAGDNRVFLIVAAIIGGYMALNIGANDVANNVAPAVGSKALTMAGALIIAAIFETAGALIAGGDVVATVSKGIIDPFQIADPRAFVLAMMAALLAAALWINLATMIGAPVSTTHAVVGGVMGAGVAAAGFQVINWPTMAKITASWVISPVLGGVIAAILLAFIKSRIIYQVDKVSAAKRWVPVLVAVMAGVFAAYLVMKGLKRVWRPEAWVIVAIGFAVFAASYAALRPIIRRAAAGMENRNKSVRSLFVIPLICAAALLSFAHGANDVANAVGPLAAIFSAATTGGITAKAEIPVWVMLVGAAGISTGLVLFGAKLVRTVGDQITRMNPTRAFCVALAAAITVIAASALGLPVSSTHIAVGAVFGVGIYREYQTARRQHINHGKYTNYGIEPKVDPTQLKLRRKLFRRRHLMTIVTAWVVTVPCTAVLAAAVFYVLWVALS